MPLPVPLHVGEALCRGRFAPTPSGALHMGSLLTALVSWLAARTVGGDWLLRIDDLDAPRCAPGAADEIMRQLEAHGLTWDETPRYQSRHVEQYEAALADLRGLGLLYRCTCTRAQLAHLAPAGPGTPVYPGTCRGSSRDVGALRAEVGNGELGIEDRWAGGQVRDVARDIGDIVVRRADGQIAYQLASVVDEREMRITEVMRGADLLGSSFQQRALMRLLNQTPPAYGHLPVLLDAAGRKLSKQNRAPALALARKSENVLACLVLIGLAPPPPLRGAAPAEILAWACDNWSAANLVWGAQTSATITYNALQQTGFIEP